MTALTVGARERSAGAALLVAGIVLAALTEAIAGTVLSLGRGDIAGDLHTTPDEFAWLDISYIALKLIGFVTAPWLMTRVPARVLVLSATIVMGLACALTIFPPWLELVIVLRVVQGFAGGALLVAGQALLFTAFPRAHQPLLQAIFAMGAVVAPSTLAPAFQGWLIDSQSWTWIFLSVAPIALASLGALLAVEDDPAFSSETAPFDWLGFALISTAFFALSFVLSQGARWNWFEEPRIVWASTLAVASFAAFGGQQMLHRDGAGLIGLSAFRSDDFAFAFIVSFVAGAALFGSAYLIPSFAVSVLAFTPTAAGLLLAPSGVVFVLTLLLAAFLIQKRGLPPIATVPFGILAIMAAMWMLSQSTAESGADSMAPALLLRGVGLGFLFLAITLIAFGNLSARDLPAGIGLFNAGRQIGGLMGVAALQSLINHNVATSLSAFSANLVAGAPALMERLSGIAAQLASRGLDAATAQSTAISQLVRGVLTQATVIAFNTAFLMLALLFVAAAPVLIAVRIGLAKKRSGGA